MNIKNRIEKLENAAGVGSEFCGCQGGIVTRIIKTDMDRPENERERLNDEAVQPEFCERCRKQIEKRLIIIQAVKGSDGPREPKPGETFATFNISTKARE